MGAVVSGAVLIVTRARYLTGRTLLTGNGGGFDTGEHLWLETDPRLLTDLRDVCDAVLRTWHPNTVPGAAAKRIYALLPKETE